jgi:uncharacterized protein YbjT (DUF2867 family)
MKIIIFGGSGLIGKKLTNILKVKGHSVVVASPSFGIDAVTGEGVNNALESADVLIDAMNSPSFEDTAVLNFFKTTTQNLITAACKAKVKHYIALSVVGTDRLQAGGYFKAKLAQETLIQESTLPYTILRATQFYEFMMSIAYVSTVNQTVRVAPAKLQPIAAEDVSKALADIALDSPLNTILEIAGPEKINLHILIKKILEAHSDNREVVADNSATYFGIPIDDSSLTPQASSCQGLIHYDEWIQQSVA